MLPDRVSNPGPLTYESGALPIALRGPAMSANEKNFHNDIRFATVSRRTYCQNFLTLSNQTLHYIPMCIRIYIHVQSQKQ